jgi:hypothetical protein
MTTLTREAHAFGQNVGVREVEDLIAGITPADVEHVELTVDLSRCGHVDPGAGFRLGNAMRTWRRGRLVVLVPDRPFSHPAWFQPFTRSGLGFAIAAHAAQVRAADRDVTAELRDYYAAVRLTGSGGYAIRANLHEGTLAPSRERFGRTFNDTLRQKLTQAHSLLDDDARLGLVRLGHEAVTNVFDHAYSAPLDDPSDPVAYLSLRWYKKLSSAPGDDGTLREYLERARGSLAEDERIAGWLELVVNDDGVGIGARQRLDGEIYTRPVAEEDAAVAMALTRGETVKLQARDAIVRGDPGYGTSIILEGLTGANAYAALRTGRRLLEFDPTVGTAAFVRRDRELGCMPGTALHVVMPVLERQLAFDVAGSG